MSVLLTYVESSYGFHKEKYIQECETLIQELRKAVKLAQQDRFLGNAMRFSCASAISERYGALYELHEVLGILEDEEDV